MSDYWKTHLLVIAEVGYHVEMCFLSANACAHWPRGRVEIFCFRLVRFLLLARIVLLTLCCVARRACVLRCALARL